MNGALVSKTMWELSADYAIAGKTNRGYRASSLTVDFTEVRETVMHAAKERQYQILSQIETFSKDKSNKGSLTLIFGYARFQDVNTAMITKKDCIELVKLNIFSCHRIKNLLLTASNSLIQKIF